MQSPILSEKKKKKNQNRIRSSCAKRFNLQLVKGKQLLQYLNMYLHRGYL